MSDTTKQGVGVGNQGGGINMETQGQSKISSAIRGNKVAVTKEDIVIYQPQQLIRLKCQQHNRVGEYRHQSQKVDSKVSVTIFLFFLLFFLCVCGWGGGGGGGGGMGTENKMSATIRRASKVSITIREEECRLPYH